MNQFIVPANGEALKRAVVALYGEEGLKALQQAYGAIDAAMAFAYNEASKVSVEDAETRGYSAGFSDADAAAKAGAEDLASENEAQMAFVFQEGERAGWTKGYDEALAEGCNEFEDGFDAGECSAQEAFDDGYVDGVHDARMWPEIADEYVAHLVACDEFDEANVSDSGDTNG